MSEIRWKRVARKEGLKDGLAISVTVDETDIFLVRLGESVYAIEGECTHYGAPLCDGLLKGKEVICPWHNARFDITTGRLKAAPALDDLRRFPLKVEDGEIYLGPPESPSLYKPVIFPGSDSPTFVIVGAGAAGNAAAETLRREGFSGRILLITAENRMPYDRPTLSKGFLSGEALPEWLPLRSEGFYEELSIELLTGRRVERLRLDERRIIFSGGEEMGFDKALLATGGIPRRIPIPGGNLQNVFVLRSMADAEAIREAAEKAERAIVLGASFMGMEVAASFRERGLKVELVAPEEIPMRRVFGDHIGRWFQRMHEKQGVQFHLGVTPGKIEKMTRGLYVHLSDGSILEADLVVAGLGVDLAVGYLEDTDLFHNGSILVDGHLQTKIRGIFAAGDIAAFPDHRTGRIQRIEHWVVAETQGQHAARAMLGSEAHYDEIPFFWTRQYSQSIKYIGYAESFDRIAF